jgi:hypothetical protein
MSAMSPKLRLDFPFMADFLKWPTSPAAAPSAYRLGLRADDTAMIAWPPRV